jgi:hypothetical protein
MKHLTPSEIPTIRDDQALYDRLAAELSARLGDSAGADDAVFVAALHRLPPGLRAMAATYQLDVSVCLDDLATHFLNWHSLPLAQETLMGLRELGATDEAALFEQAIGIITPHWDLLEAPDFRKQYRRSSLEAALRPIDDALGALLGYSPVDRSYEKKNLLSRWVPYARTHPDRVCDPGAT